MIIKKSRNCLHSLFAATLLALSTLAGIMKAETKTFKSFDVEITGKGQPIIFIHGYASESSVWNETVEYLNSEYECHAVQLAGFAGRASIKEEEYLSTIRDDIAEYIINEKLGKVILTGHSMGGFLSLWIAAEYPDLVSKVISVDGLPFLSAVINPSATSTSQIEYAKKAFRYEYDFEPTEEILSDEDRQNIFAAMTLHKDKIEVLQEWIKKSDPRTLNQAMFEMMITDIREDIKTIKVPVLVFGAWIAYKNYGATRESTSALYASQYKNVKDFTIKLTDTGKHFIMWDDFEWFSLTIKEFLSM